MCGIVAYKGAKDASKIAFEGLKSLEYRGYDSWGIATLSGSKISVVKDVGKISSSNGVRMLPGRIAFLPYVLKEHKTCISCKAPAQQSERTQNNCSWHKGYLLFV